MKTNTYEIPYPSEWGPETITAEAVLARANLIADEALARVITHTGHGSGIICIYASPTPHP